MFNNIKLKYQGENNFFAVINVKVNPNTASIFTAPHTLQNENQLHILNKSETNLLYSRLLSKYYDSTYTWRI